MNTPTRSDRVVVVTGASDGIGAAIARELKRRGDHVVLVGRSPAKTKAVAAELDAETYIVDFTHLDQVRGLAAELRQRHVKIDVLVNNAGLCAGSRRELTADGHELTFQVNHLAPFLLTRLLRPQLAAAGAAVLVTSSSAGTDRRAAIDLDDLDMSRQYSAFRAYRASKLANVLFTRELTRRWGPDGVTAAAVHPGAVRSQFGQSGPLAVRFLVKSPFRLLMRSPERGADTLVWLATTTPGTDWQSGGYYANRRQAKPNPLADDQKLSVVLWERSESLCGL